MNEINLTNMTYQERKASIKEGMIKATESFLAIGYQLRQIYEQELFREDGYNTIYEFANSEYRISRSTTNRFMGISRKFTVEGAGQELLPQYSGVGVGMLQEMLNLTEQDCELFVDNVDNCSRDNIRELKNYRKEEDKYIKNTVQGEQEEEQEPDPQEPKQVVEAEKEHIKEFTDLEKILLYFFKEAGKQKQRHGQLLELQKIVSSGNVNMERVVEILNPNENYTMRTGFYFVFFFDLTKGIKYTKFGQTQYINITYQEALETIKNLFDFTVEDAWLKQYGTEEVIEEKKTELRSAQPQKNTSTQAKIREEKTEDETEEEEEQEETENQEEKEEEQEEEQEETDVEEPEEVTDSPEEAMEEKQEQVVAQLPEEPKEERIETKVESVTGEVEEARKSNLEWIRNSTAEELAKKAQQAGYCPTDMKICRKDEGEYSEDACSMCWMEWFSLTH